MNRRFFWFLTIAGSLIASSISATTIWEANGYFGIGTQAPTSLLHLKQGGQAQLTIENSVSSNAALALKSPSSNWAIKTQPNQGSLLVVNESTQFTSMSFKGQSVGIGTSTPNPNYMLTVNGTLYAQDISLKTDTWADYVFDPNYALMPLSELKKFVRQNRHLPNIPSQAEILKNGIPLSKTNVSLLEKIEELTLYVIQINEENKQLKQRVDTLESN